MLNSSSQDVPGVNEVEDMLSLGGIVLSLTYRSRGNTFSIVPFCCRVSCPGLCISPFGGRLIWYFWFFVLQNRLHWTMISWYTCRQLINIRQLIKRSWLVDFFGSIWRANETKFGLVLSIEECRAHEHAYERSQKQHSGRLLVYQPSISGLVLMKMLTWFILI